MDLSLETYSHTLAESRNIPFTSTLRNRFLRMPPASWKNYIIILLVSQAYRRKYSNSNKNLNAVGIIGTMYWGGKDK